jgi:hypothetical protein
MNNRTKYVYICSAGHSGSTLLDLLLGSHSQIESLGEIIHLAKNISLNTQCTCGEPVRSCPVWKQVVSILNEQLGIDIFNAPYALNVGFPLPQVIKDKIHTTFHYKLRRKFFRGLRYIELKYELCFLKHFLNSIYEGIKNTILVYEAVRKVLQCQMIVDSSKSYLESIGIYNNNPDNVRILLLCRDGRGVLYSHIKRNFSRNKGLRGWKNHYKRAIPLFEKYVNDNHVLRVKYEHIVQDPTAELKRICRFLNVEFEKDMLNFASHVHHITNGNDMRFSKSSEIRLDTEWMSELSEADRAFFDKMAGDLNRSLGYV